MNIFFTLYEIFDMFLDDWPSLWNNYGNWTVTINNWLNMNVTLTCWVPPIPPFSTSWGELPRTGSTIGATCTVSWVVMVLIYLFGEWKVSMWYFVQPLHCGSWTDFPTSLSEYGWMDGCICKKIMRPPIGEEISFHSSNWSTKKWNRHGFIKVWTLSKPPSKFWIIMITSN